MKQVIAIICAIIATALFAISCTSSDETPPPPPSGSLVEDFGNGGIVVENPTGDTDEITSILVSGSSIYVAGSNYAGSGDTQWRLEKRNKSDGALDPAFGSGGVIVHYPEAGYNGITALASDGVNLYIGGYEIYNGSSRWRIEKRSLATGGLMTMPFGGVMTSNSNSQYNALQCMALDGSDVFAAGTTSTGVNGGQCQIEKWSKSMGNFVSGFGSPAGSPVTSDPSTQSDRIYSISIYDGFIYAGGVQNFGSEGVTNGRLEKRSAVSGALVSGFGSGGVITYGPDYVPTWLNWVLAREEGLFVVARQSASTGISLSKLDPATGAAYYRKDFGDAARYSAAGIIDGGAIYLVINSWPSGQADYSWRIDKRRVSDGELLADFGSGGIVELDPSANSDRPTAIACDADYIYVAGYDEVHGLNDSQWRIEKRYK